MIELILLLVLMMLPMIAGGITVHYSHTYIHEETINRWRRLGYESSY